MKPTRKKQVPLWCGVLRTWREDRGLTRRDAAKKLGVPARTLEMWELGREPLPWVKTLLGKKFRRTGIDVDQTTRPA